MPLVSLVLSVDDNTPQVAADDSDSPIVLGVAILISLACAASTGPMLSIVGAACVAIMIPAALVAAVTYFNFALATLIWTRRPPLHR